MKKRINTNPRRGAKHWKAPSRIFWKTLRGMLPHKSPRGAAALDRLKCFDGMPFPYDQKKRMVIPEALKCLRLKSRRNFCSLGELATVTGWTKAGVISDLEDKRKVKSAAYYESKQKKADAKAKAMSDKRLDSYNKELSKLGF
jgi:large subunit ribosomal protein L13Ae